MNQKKKYAELEDEQYQFDRKDYEKYGIGKSRKHLGNGMNDKATNLPFTKFSKKPFKGYTTITPISTVKALNKVHRNGNDPNQFPQCTE